MSGDPRFYPPGDQPYAHPYHAQSHRSSPLLPALVVLLFLGVAAVGAGLFVLWRHVHTGTRGVDPDAESRAITPRGELADLEKASIAIYKENLPSVVHVTTLVRQSSFGQATVPSGTGSGFVWDADGHIVTNYHVIQKADSARVTFSDKTTYPAYYVGGRADKDLAVLYVDAPREKLRPIALGTSKDLQVGQLAFAIGNPFGLDYTYTMGIVSALGREIESAAQDEVITGVIQTDAAINPGNSGGPLLDSAGRLIGVNTAIYSKSGASAGIGFAIPVDEVNGVVPKIIREGNKDVPKQRKTRPGLGIQVASDDLAKQHGVTSGVVIAKVLPGTGAEKAGLVATRVEGKQVIIGDVITAVDDAPVTKVDDLLTALQGHKVGDVVALTVQRGGKASKVKVTLGTVD
jgi:S1-C subfamily serine protease